MTKGHWKGAMFQKKTSCGHLEDSRDEGAKKCPLQATGWHASPSLLPGCLLGPLWIHFLFLQLEVPLEEDSCGDRGGYCENPLAGGCFYALPSSWQPECHQRSSSRSYPWWHELSGDISCFPVLLVTNTNCGQTQPALHNYSFKELSTKRWSRSMWHKGTRSQPRPRSTIQQEEEGQTD